MHVVELRNDLRHHRRRRQGRRRCRWCRRFYDLGFNIEATTGTAEFLQCARHPHPHAPASSARAARRSSTHCVRDMSATSSTRIDINQHNTRLDGYEIRRTRRREQRDGLHGAGNGEGAARRAGGDHAARFDHRFKIISISCGTFRPSLLAANGQYLVYSPSASTFGQAEICSPEIKIPGEVLL